jgi:hypothetical protein
MTDTYTTNSMAQTSNAAFTTRYGRVVRRLSVAKSSLNHKFKSTNTRGAMKTAIGTIAPTSTTTRYGRVVGRSSVSKTEKDYDALDERLIHWDMIKKAGMGFTRDEVAVNAKLLQSGVILPGQIGYQFLPTRRHYSFLRDFSPEHLNVHFW